MSKQCTCGRSQSYPFCDNTHAQPSHPVIQTINPHAFSYFNKKDSQENIAVQVPKFISKGMSKDLIDVFEKDELWQDVGFHKASNLFHIDFVDNKDLANLWEELVSTIKRATEIIFKDKVINTGLYIQKWPEGSYGIKHNDMYNFDGSIGNLTSRIATTLFLYSPFTGGNLEFPDHELVIEPKMGSLYLFKGGPENEHQISEILSGLRYTVIAFWDFESSTYTDEELKGMEDSKKKWENYMKTGEGL